MTAGDGSEPVPVAFARDRAEAGLIQGLLEEAGIPSALQPLGLDGPTIGFGLLNPGGGERRVMVRADHAERAREILDGTFVEGEPERWHDEIGETGAEPPRGRARDYNVIGAYARAFFWSVLIMALVFGVFMLLRVV